MGAQCGGGAGRVGLGWVHIWVTNTRDLCFFNVISPEFRDNVSVTFIDNTAGGHGLVLYGL